MKDDIAWLLYVSRKWLGGRVLYQDLIEVNPPLIIWMSAVPSIVAHWLDVSAKFVAPPMFMAQTLLCAWWSATILKRSGGLFSDRYAVFGVLGTLMLLLPGADLGQREHLLVSGFLPYLALSSQEIGGQPTRRIEGAAAGLVAALFCGLKPLYALCFVTVEVAMLLAGRSVWRVMPWAAAATLAGYGLLVVGVCPTYLKQAVPMALALYGATDVSFVDLLNDSAVLLLGEAIAVALLFYRWRIMAHRNLMVVLTLFAVTSTLVCFGDGKNWYYHRIPATIATCLALLVWIAEELRNRRWIMNPALISASLAVMLFCGFSVQQLEPQFRDAIDPQRSVVDRLEDIIRADHARTYIAFSEWIALGFPVVNNTGVTWTSRFDSMWALKGEVWRKGFDTAVAREWPIGRWIAHDFISGCPDIAVVDTREPIDYINVLKIADPAFARVWTRYKRIARFDGLDVYKRSLGGCLDVWVAAAANPGTVTR